MIIKFKNWEKYQIRSDSKCSWFRLQNDIFYDPQIATLDPIEFQIFIYLMCEASRKGDNGSLVLVREHIQRIIQGSDQRLDQTIKKLKSYQIIESRTLRGRYASVRELHATNNTNKQTNNTGHTQPIVDRIGFNFDLIYQEYPRKLGKREGIKRCVQQIKTQDDYELLMKAVKAYSLRCQKENTEEKYIKHFSSFMGSDWRSEWGAAPPEPKQKIYSTAEEYIKANGLDQ